MGGRWTGRDDVARLGILRGARTYRGVAGVHSLVRHLSRYALPVENRGVVFGLVRHRTTPLSLQLLGKRGRRPCTEGAK